MTVLTSIEAELPAIAARLPNLAAMLPAIARAARVAEGVALVLPALVADILALRASPSIAAVEKFAADLEAAWPTVNAALTVNTVAEGEPPAQAAGADALNAAEAARGSAA
jgi:hypothetical protein